MDTTYELGTVEAAEGIIKDLYVDLRRKMRQWSSITLQTPQARMGYVGQHLVSAVTGYQGGRSGARGRDLILSHTEHAEIKTCSRVDQLGSCRRCEARVSPIETLCPQCGSDFLVRKDDSKWLISVKSKPELNDLFESKFFFFVLFDFEDLEDASTINARIWRINPRTKSFAYCMVDYFHNIGSASSSGAPFNMWPFKLKFDLLLPDLIFHALIREDDTVSTLVFEEMEGQATKSPLPDLEKYSRAGGEELNVESLRTLLNHLGADSAGSSKRELLRALQAARLREGIPDEDLADLLADSLYGRRIREFLSDLPKGVPPPTLL